jgi:hypothetical protein
MKKYGVLLAIWALMGAMRVATAEEDKGGGDFATNRGVFGP